MKKQFTKVAKKCKWRDRESGCGKITVAKNFRRRICWMIFPTFNYMRLFVLKSPVIEGWQTIIDISIMWHNICINRSFLMQSFDELQNPRRGILPNQARRVYKQVKQTSPELQFTQATTVEYVMVNIITGFLVIYSHFVLSQRSQCSLKKGKDKSSGATHLIKIFNRVAL